MHYTFYTYRIDFATGHYYYGKKKIESDPYSDGYYGSPVRHKFHWEESIHCKSVLFYHYDDNEALEIESQLIGDSYKTDPLCLNAHNTDSFTTTGYRHTEGTKKKWSAQRKGRVPWNKGRQHSEETRRKIREGNKRHFERTGSGSAKGKKWSEESRQRLSEAMKGKPSPRKGVPHTPESIAKMKTAAQNRGPLSMEHKRKISNSLSKCRGKHYELLLEGKPITIFNMARYCRDNNLSRDVMKRIINGRRKEYKGHTLP